MPTKVLPSGTHAVLAIDPGGTTGVFAGHVQLNPSSLKETLLSIRRRKAIEVGGSWKEQAKKLVDIMNSFVFSSNVEYGLPIQCIHIVFEDFVLRTDDGGRAGTTNLTSIWVMAGAIVRYETDHETTPVVQIDYQQASEAKGKAKNDRLRLWGLWEVGSEHKRDAARHFALRVDKLLLGK